MILAYLDRFGYQLTTISENKEQAKKAIMSEYKKAYKMRNECEPTQEELKNAQEEVVICEMTLNKIEWL